MTEDDDYHAAVRIIANSPNLRAELERVGPFLAAKVRPLEPLELMKKLIENAPPFGIQARSPEQWSALFNAYLDALAPLSAEMLDDAFLRWNRGELYPKEPGRHAFYPRPAELFSLAEPSRLQLHQAAYRAKKAAEHVEKAPPPKPTEAERSARRQQLIDQGLLDVDGHVILPTKGVPAPPRRSGSETPHEMAERLRAAADDDWPEEAV